MNPILEKYIYDTQIQQWLEFIKWFEKKVYWFDNRRKYFERLYKCKIKMTGLSGFVKLDNIPQMTNIEWDTDVINSRPDNKIKITINEKRPVFHVKRFMPKKSSKTYCEDDMGSVLSNPSIVWKRNYVYRLMRYKYTISKHPNITWDFVSSTPEIYWNWLSLTENPNITWDIIKNNPKLWNWNSVIMNPNITWDIVKSNDYVYDYRTPEKPEKIDWYYPYYAYNPNITMDIIQNNGELECDLDYESYCKKLREKYNDKGFYCCDVYCDGWDVKADKDSYERRWRAIAQNPKISFESLLEAQRKHDNPIIFKTLISSPHITWDFIKSNFKRFEEAYCWSDGEDWSEICHENEMNTYSYYNPHYLLSNVCQNPFTYQLELVRQECIRKWYAAKKIRRWWLFKVYFNPFTKVGARRLERSYHEMLNQENN